MIMPLPVAVTRLLVTRPAYFCSLNSSLSRRADACNQRPAWRVARRKALFQAFVDLVFGRLGFTLDRRPASLAPVRCPLLSLADRREPSHVIGWVVNLADRSNRRARNRN